MDVEYQELWNPSAQSYPSEDTTKVSAKKGAKKTKSPTLADLAKLFNAVILKLQGKKQSQFSLFKEIDKLLEDIKNKHQVQEIVLSPIKLKEKIFDKKRMNSIQIALYYNSFAVLKVLLNRIDRPEYLEKYELLDQAVISLDDAQLNEVLKHYADCLIDVNCTRLSPEAQSCLYEGSWNQTTIEALYPFTKSFFIPREQKKAKMVALVCYNTFDVETDKQKKRVGAKQEAECIIKAFGEYGCTVRLPLIDWTFDELLRYLRGNIEEIKDSCSTVFISIMSHGAQGVIFDKKGHEGEINKILNVLYILREILPVVLLIQACQGDREPKQQLNISHRNLDGHQDDSVPRNQAGGADNPGLHPDLVSPHITVLRPNTMVVTATTEYTVAKRSVFLRHFAKELENADGMTTINTIVQLSSRAMSLHHDDESRKQAPATYGVLRQPMILPRSVALDRKRLQDPEQQSGTWHNMMSMLYEIKKRAQRNIKDRCRKT